MYFKNHKARMRNNEGGFTIIEIAVVILIFGIVTALVLNNYNRFTNDAILTNMAYEMALSVREAQTFGVAVSNRKVSFDTVFGVNFTIPSGSSGTSVYHLFEDVGGYENRYDHGATCPSIEEGQDTCQQQYVLQRNINIVDLWVKGSSGCQQVDDINIAFDRPNPEPLIFGDGSNYQNQNLAQITLQSPENTERHVFVRRNGQIFVDSNPECSIN